MSILQTLFVAILQGITEILPISSSAHIKVLPQIFGWDKPTQLFTLVTHMGSLVAILFYYKFRISYALHSLIKKKPTKNNLAWKIIIATIPASILGFIAGDFIKIYLFNNEVIIYNSIIFALILCCAAIYQKNVAYYKKLTFRAAFLIGCGQMLALIPGTSRLGITISVALFLNIKPKIAVEFSLLLAIPIILGANILEFIKLEDFNNLEPLSLMLGFITSAIFSYMMLKFITPYLQNYRVITTLGLYRIVFALGLAAII